MHMEGIPLNRPMEVVTHRRIYVPMTFDNEKPAANRNAFFAENSNLISIEAGDVLLSLEKQHQISKKDLNALSDAATDATHIRKLLAHYELVSNSALTTLDSLLATLGLQHHRLFKNATLGARLEFYARINNAVHCQDLDQALMIEAADAVIDRAESPEDFAARYQFYFCCTKKLRLEGATPSRRSTRIKRIQNAMETALGEYLRGPEICIPPPPQLIWDLLDEWFTGKGSIGFSNIGTGLLLTARHITLTNLSHLEIARAVHDFVKHMQIFFKHHQATGAQLAQIDERWIYRFDYPEVRARLTLVPGGQLLLEDYHLVCSRLMEETYARDEGSSSHLQA